MSVKRSPAQQAATMTRLNPAGSKCVSPDTSSTKPIVMMSTTSPNRQVGLWGGTGAAQGRCRGGAGAVKRQWVGVV